MGWWIPYAMREQEEGQAHEPHGSGQVLNPAQSQLFLAAFQEAKVGGMEPLPVSCLPEALQMT